MKEDLLKNLEDNVKEVMEFFLATPEFEVLFKLWSQDIIIEV